MKLEQYKQIINNQSYLCVKALFDGSLIRGGVIQKKMVVYCHIGHELFGGLHYATCFTR